MVTITDTRLSGKTTNPGQIYLAADLGKSNCKLLWASERAFFPHPVWLSSEIARNVSNESLRRFEVVGEVSAETLWLTLDNQNTLVGGSAMGFPVSFASDKIDIAALQVAAGLGLAAIELGLSEYNATVALAVPLNEYTFRSEISNRLEVMGERIAVCGQAQKFTSTVQFFPEGMGLFLLYRAMKLASNGGGFPKERTITLMLGHRNLTILVFDDGKLNVQLSQTSDALGFWHTFKAQADASGVRETDYQALMAAVTTGKLEQLSITKARIRDYSQEASAVAENYMAKVDQFYQDHVLPLLRRGEQTTIILGGGVSRVMSRALQAYFEKVGFVEQNNLWFADLLNPRLHEIARASHMAEGDPARAMRFADCYGIYQAMLSSVKQ